MSLKLIALALVFSLLMFTLPAMTAIATSSSGTINENDLTSSSWWNSNWFYRRPITITAGEDGMPENYQVSILLTYDSDMAFENFQDSRFVWENSSGNYERPFWFENVNLGENVENAWVKLPNDVSFGADQSYDNLKWYYGNASAGSAENGDATFEFFDHFPSASLDGGKWTSTGNPIVADSYVKLTDDTITTIGNWGTNKSARMKVDLITQGAGANTWGWGGVSGVDAVFQDYTTGRTLSYESATESQAWAEDLNEETYDVHRNSTTSVIFVEAGVTKNTHSTQVPTSDLNGYLGNDSTTEIWCDWFLIRQYISPEPTASVGAEETTASWHLIETWTGTVSAPLQWNHIETWTGTVSASIAPAQWRLIETWTGTVNAPASWNLIETWAGTVQTTGYVWNLIETWTAIVKAPAEWSLIETWSGTVNAPTQWNLIETWTGTVTASAQWSLIESWTGLVQAPAAWQLIENWIGTVEASVPPILAWRLIENWTGTVEALVPPVPVWQLIETWINTVDAPVPPVLAWQLFETWTGIVEAPTTWQTIENWTGTVEAPVPPVPAWQLIETWVGTIATPNTPVGIDVTVVATDPETGEPTAITVTFENVTTSGSTTSTVVEGAPPAGIKLFPENTYYDITTTAEYTENIIIAVYYGETGLTQEQENNLKLMKLVENEWVDITDWVDTENKIIYGTTTSLSLFGVMLEELGDLNPPPPGVPDWIPPRKREDWVPPSRSEDWVPPGKRDDWVPPGKREDWVPLGKRDDWVPPGKREVPPGQPEDWVPPGQDENLVPSGQDEDWIPPGQSENRVPPGQAKK